VDLLKETKVLFVCTGNSARSQMAEALLRHIAGDQFSVTSAGTNPKGLNPLAVHVMREIGVDISGQQSKDVARFLGEHFGYVITVCDKAKESCPIFPFAFRSLHWDLEDPAAAEGSDEDRLELFRRTRDAIRDLVAKFVADHRSGR
jgi:arsenate reductase